MYTTVTLHDTRLLFGAPSVLSTFHGGSNRKPALAQNTSAAAQAEYGTHSVRLPPGAEEFGSKPKLPPV